jgi:CBS domain-containing protein
MLQIRDVMTRHVFTVTPQTTMREAADLFTRHHISGAPVMAGHDVVGVVSATDLLAFVASNERAGPPDDESSDPGFEQWSREEFENEAASLFFSDRQPEDNAEDDERFAMDNTQRGDLFNAHTVDEVMTRTICSLSPEAAVTEAAQYMWQAGIHRLLVLDEGHLMGILSMSDVARVLATAS